MEDVTLDFYDTICLEVSKKLKSFIRTESIFKLEDKDIIVTHKVGNFGFKFKVLESDRTGYVSNFALINQL